MFKGLKFKLEDEAKRLQATVTQYGENIAQQVRSGASDSGSDITGYTRRFFKSSSASVQMLNESTVPESMIENLYLPLDTKIISLDNDQEKKESNFDETDYFQGIRCVSHVSIESNESGGANTNPQSGALRLNMISSDVESNSCSMTDCIYDSANKNQKESVSESKLQKLYKLLEKSRDKICTLKSQMVTVNEENSSLKSQLLLLGQDSLAVEKLTTEWKGRIDRLEDKWQHRLASCNDKSSIVIATIKAETHAALQQKDLEIQDWINKFHIIEKKNTDDKYLWRSKVEELKELVVTLENEKANMIRKLSQTKQEGLKENAGLLRRCKELESLCEMAKPLEIEYLRNVLYCYMAEREILGKDIITLARVIGTVVRFTSDQLSFVLKKEEMRFNQS